MYGGDIDRPSLSLYIAAFAIFSSVLLSPLSAICQRVPPAQLNATLLNDDGEVNLVAERDVCTSSELAHAAVEPSDSDADVCVRRLVYPNSLVSS